MAYFICVRVSDYCTVGKQQDPAAARHKAAMVTNISGMKQQGLAALCSAKIVPRVASEKEQGMTSENT